MQLHLTENRVWKLARSALAAFAAIFPASEFVVLYFLSS
jgi:hypothetical protein